MSWPIGKIKDAAKGRAEDVTETKAFLHWMKRYPLFSVQELLKEIENFDKDFVETGFISEMSSNYNKYLRGYLVRAHRQKKTTSED